ncbi:uncharacterized protein DSM5745_02937 [Aspergillus mulundensis]|uniref:SnoaL-like domain-containing protein n=1 Tax=Aspergillus mulundensis TaxID=1810919 RepID=A0A3D8SIX9_9EURO|nr:Uncharacterized protein DSM5745_02937 [Aspergillus mulundensis]RDW86295.1 Uncharacterized protein DSM5745_02937 [Aspergillus mulundensis]
MPPYTRATLTNATQFLLHAFSSSSDLPTLLNTFTTSPSPTVHEHGLPQLAPFLGRTFTGRQQVEEYFNLLSEHLGIENMRFDDEKEWAVDVETGVVCLKGYARFTSKKSGQGWDEVFTYRIGLVRDEKEDKVKVRRYEVWADTGAAYLAAKGELESLS